MILENLVNDQLVADRVGNIREMISLRSTNPVTIVAVTKGFGVDAITAAAKVGVHDIGENYELNSCNERTGRQVNHYLVSNWQISVYWVSSLREFC